MLSTCSAERESIVSIKIFSCPCARITSTSSTDPIAESSVFNAATSLSVMAGCRSPSNLEPIRGVPVCSAEIPSIPAKISTGMAIIIMPMINTSADLDTNITLTESQIRDAVGAMGSNWERIPEKGDGYEYKVKNGSVEYTHYYQFSGSYAEKTFTWSGQTKTIHRAACGPTSCVNLATGYGVDCNPTNDIVGLNFDATIPGCAKFFEDLTGVTSQTDFSESGSFSTKGTSSEKISKLRVS